MNKKFQLSIILTHSCNLNCIYCYEQNKDHQHIKLNLAKLRISQALNDSSYDFVQIDLFGGEPFLKFDIIKDLCEWVWTKEWNNKYIFFITSNGTLVHGEIADWLRCNKDKVIVSLSLDGEKESHNVNRSNSFDKIDIQFFKDCWPNQSVKMTISKESVHHIADNIIYIHSLGFNLAGTNFAEGLDWEDNRYLTIVEDELKKLSEFYISHPDIKVAPIFNMPLYKCEWPKEKHKWCGCGEHMTAMETNGISYPCTFFTPMTFDNNLLSEVLDIDWSNPELFIDRECEANCYIEPICNNCYGANMLSTGKINKRDRSKCKLTILRAQYSALIAAHKILNRPQNTTENYQTIKAIRKIKDLF